MGGMRKRQLIHAYHTIISIENLLEAWQEFLRGKSKKEDVQRFQYRLFDNILTLHDDLRRKTYEHGGYESFAIADPKPRNIHKASVRDRLLHHALYRILCPFFDTTFIADSYSCRLGKGVHKALYRFRRFVWKVSRNHTRTAWVLKGDVRKCFASIDQDIMLDILRKRIADEDVLWLLQKVIRSFHSGQTGGGLPLGNLTSQLLVNVYLNEFDQFMKHQVKAESYIRYADDFVVLSRDKECLKTALLQAQAFLKFRLHLDLHPDKVSIETMASGVDFLGWVHFPDHRVLRTVTKKRMWRTIQEKNRQKETVRSYLGMLSHGNAHKLRNRVQGFL